MTESWPAQPGYLRAENISVDPDLYEIENQAADLDGTIMAAMRRICPWDGKVLLPFVPGTGTAPAG
jgi:hypothetical protein